MPASKRRLADERKALAARAQHSVSTDDIAAQLGGTTSAGAATGAATDAEPVATATAETAIAETTAKPKRPQRQRYVETDPAYIPWPRPALMALLAMVFIAQVLIGLGQHFIWHRDRLIWIDLFFPNAVLLLVATVVVAPLLKRLLNLPRHLRWLESLSLGAVYALVVTLLSLTLIHPVYPASTKSPSADDLMNALGNGDVPGLVIADTFGILFAAQLFPGLSRLITAPGRKAKARLEEKQKAAGRTPAARGRAPAKRAARPAAKKAAAKPAAKGRR